jgi:hypothetical protein
MIRELGTNSHWYLVVQYVVQVLQRQDVLFTSFRGASERKMGGKYTKLGLLSGYAGIVWL